MTTCASPLTTRWGRWSWLFLLSLCLGTLSLSALAQIGTGTIRGTVTDEQGAAVAGATVTLTNPATGTTRTQTTNEAGTFAFTGVPAATYTLKVEATNFKVYEQSDIRARVDGSTTLGVVLSVGEATETVTVTGSGSEAIVNRQDASIGNTIAQRQILELPLAARNIAGLLSLQPGVAPDGSVSGSRSDQGNITLDGVDINEQQNNSAFAPVLRTSPESVEEFRVTVSNPNANQGRSSGAQNLPRHQERHQRVSRLGLFLPPPDDWQRWQLVHQCYRAADATGVAERLWRGHWRPRGQGPVLLLLQL